MSRHGSYAAAFFDVGNTLLFPYPSVSHVVERILAEAGHIRDLGAIDALMPLVEEYYEERFRADDSFWTSEETTSEVWVGMYALLARRLGIAENAEDLARAVYDEFGKPEHWRAFDDVVPAFRRLRDSGMKVGVISNWDTRLEGLLEGLGLTEYLSTVVCSAAVGLHKPDPRIFQMACERLEVAPEACIHVGDHVYSDVMGAQGAGLVAVLIDRRGCTREMPVPAIATLDELEEAI